MSKKKILAYSLASALLIIVVSVFWSYKNKIVPPKKPKQSSEVISNSQPQNYADNPELVGPRGNVPDGAPKDNGFDNFAIPVPGILSRSGQPSLEDFKWLKQNGWKSVVDFREDGEKSNQYALDSKLPGFNDLGLNFLSLPVKDGTAPSIEQADQFLKFVTDPKNQPAHVHCAAGTGRTGVAVALYRYSVQGWPMDKAIAEKEIKFGSGNKVQRSWLLKWAENNSPGSYAK
ncbi:MAG: tyrosine-protein phosphatase [Candidatus Moranbacteria bacterium]|nr:tyrosine-protein phosphatase [Candidatus Moranbacteria bacterium]